MERATGTEVYGCGSPQTSDITLNIQTTTGGNFSISLNPKNTVEHLKKLVSKKLKVSKDRICLLHRERQLRDGTLEENGLLDGSRVILLPSVETGLLSHRPENSVMQALESLNDTQVNDFLSGKSPLNLTMRLGDHMMLIQLQLSTLNTSSGSCRSLRTSTPTKSSSTSIRTTKCDARDSPSPQTATLPTCTPVPMDHSYISSETPKPEPETTHGLQKQDFEMLQNCFDLYRSMAEEKYGDKDSCDDKDETLDTTNCTVSDLSDTSTDNEQSPIKSLSNLVSSPIDAASAAEIRAREKAALINTVKNNLKDFLAQNNITDGEDIIPERNISCDKQCASTSSHTTDSSLSDDSDNFTDQSSFLAESTIDEYPMENLFNSAVDKGLFEDQDESMMDREISNLATTSHGSQEANAGTLPSFQSINEPLKNKRFQYLLHKTSKFKHPIGQNKQKAFMQSVVNKHKKRMQSRQDTNLSQPSTSRTEPYITNSRKLILQPSNGNGQVEDIATPSTSKQIIFKAPDAPKKPQRASPTPPVDTKALIEASKNLTQKLKKLSKEVLTNKIELRAAEETTLCRKIGPGAVIESMKHHGKGIYSGTFSGTLNPALQDRYGRPKRDISTIIHILNDLLCAAPPMAITQNSMGHSCARRASCSCGGALGGAAARCECDTTACPRRECDSATCPRRECDSATCPRRECEAAACPRRECEAAACPRLEPKPCSACVASVAGEMCKKCDTAKTLALDNSKTKCKLEQLRLVMQQKKQRREARKLKTLPYTASPAKTISSPEQAAGLQDEIETLA